MSFFPTLATGTFQQTFLSKQGEFMQNKVLVAMSGGVDSSVAAYLMKNQGFEVSGAIMHLLSSSCIGADDARLVCEKLGIDFSVFDMRTEFENRVISSFVSAYENGLTPNPCIECNRYMKFSAFMKEAETIGIKNIATGHYAQSVCENGQYYLKKGFDKSKDQTYFLYHLKREQLSRVFFPLGDMNKDEIRKIAEENGFVNAHKKDSQDICFVPDGNYISVIKNYTNKTYPQGDFVDMSNNKIGTHQGIINYTVGQRKGLGQGFGKRLYVHSKNPLTNQVVLADDKELFSDRLTASDFNWLTFDKAPEKLKAYAKIRYSATETPCTVHAIEEDKFLVEFDSPQRAIAKGQAIVIYDGDYVLGGGTIV